MYLDFQAIKDAHPIETVMQRLGLEMKQTGKQWRGKCPVCEAKGDRNLVITPEKGVFYCFSDGKGGDVIQLVAHIEGVGIKQAAAWIAGDTPEREAKPKERAAQSSEGFQPLQYLEPDHPAVEALGIEPETATALGIGYAPRGVLRGTVAVPLRRPDGAIAGYVGLTEIEKLPPQVGDMRASALLFFNLATR